MDGGALPSPCPRPMPWLPALRPLAPTGCQEPQGLGCGGGLGPNPPLLGALHAGGGGLSIPTIPGGQGARDPHSDFCTTCFDGGKPHFPGHCLGLLGVTPTHAHIIHERGPLPWIPLACGSHHMWFLGKPIPPPWAEVTALSIHASDPAGGTPSPAMGVGVVCIHPKPSTSGTLENLVRCKLKIGLPLDPKF